MEDASCLITKTTEHAQPAHSDVQPWHAHVAAGIVPSDDIPMLEAEEATYQVVAQLQLVAPHQITACCTCALQRTASTSSPTE